MLIYIFCGVVLSVIVFFVIVLPAAVLWSFVCHKCHACCHICHACRRERTRETTDVEVQHTTSPMPATEIELSSLEIERRLESGDALNSNRVANESDRASDDISSSSGERVSLQDFSDFQEDETVEK